jgi:hypothetical protein
MTSRHISNRLSFVRRGIEFANFGGVRVLCGWIGDSVEEKGVVDRDEAAGLTSVTASS